MSIRCWLGFHDYKEVSRYGYIDDSYGAKSMSSVINYFCPRCRDVHEVVLYGVRIETINKMEIK